MTQRQLDRAVARATGESLSTIRHMGFTTLEALDDDGDREPLVLDWDSLDAQRRSGTEPYPWPSAA
jgi:hypothetical protein